MTRVSLLLAALALAAAPVPALLAQGTGSLVVQVTAAESGAPLGGAQVKVDGAVRGVTDLVFNNPDVEGIEIYPGVVPPQFGGSTAMCGVIAVWTRDAP